MHAPGTRLTRWLLVAVLLGSAGCQSDRVTGPRPNFATAAALYNYDWFAAGFGHSCLSRAPAGTGNFTLLCWGTNSFGQLGLGGAAGGRRLTPTAVPNNTGSILASGNGGYGHHCAISAGRAYCWGLNNYGQLGDGTKTNRTAPVLVQGGITWYQIATGDYHTCGLNDIGVAYCWGQGAKGQLGNNGTVDKLFPTPVSTALAFSALHLGYGFTCGLQRISGAPKRIYCWGYNGYGQLGVGNTTNLLKPGAFVYGGAKWDDVTVGNLHVCAVTYPTVTGTPNWCWGYNFFGQLGNNQTSPRDIPHQVYGGFRMHPIVAGGYFSCGRRVDTGRMFCWGKGGEGQLGNGYFVNRLAPYPVYGDHIYTSAPAWYAAGEYHVIARRNDNAVMAWGYNNFGQVGDGTTYTRERPVLILQP